MHNMIVYQRYLKWLVKRLYIDKNYLFANISLTSRKKYKQYASIAINFI